MAPFDRLTVTIIGSISGVRPTATARRTGTLQPVVLAEAVKEEYIGTMTTMKLIINQVN